MISSHYYELALRTAQIGDEFARCFNRRRTLPPEERKYVNCMALANRYRTALDAQIAYLKAASDAESVRETLQTVIRSKEQFEKALEMLTSAPRDPS
jgi:Ser/Thr protein kinase RdoA (MazF antagonist)